MKKYASNLSTVISIVMNMTRIVFVLMFLTFLGGYIYSLSNDYTFTLNQIDLGGIVFGLKDTVVTNGTMSEILLILVIGTPLMCIPFLMILKSLKKITVSVKQERPFTTENAKLIKKISILVYVSSIVSSTVASLMRSTMMMAIQDSFINGTIKVVKHSFTIIKLDMIFISAIIYLIALVFEYGAKLQEESDTTL